MNAVSYAMQASTKPDVTLADIHLALAEVAAARAIVQASQCRAASARVHLLAAAQCVGLERILNDESCKSAADERSVVAANCDALQAQLEQLLLRHGDRPRLAVSRFRWGLRALAWMLAPIAVVVLVAKPWQKPSQGPWRGAYYATDNLSGQPLVRHDPDVAFQWGHEAPMDAIPGELFSVQWDTCLTLAAASSVSWQLIFDDGARLYLDGKLILDGWRLRERQSQGATVTMLAGRHHVRVHYVDHHGPALAQLFASFRGEVPASIPSEWLTLPQGGIEVADPCSVDPAVALRDVPSPAKTPAKGKTKAQPQRVLQADAT